jgi:hypothetical protein
MSSGEVTRDAVGQFVRVGDLVAGVRAGRYPVTVAGQLLDFSDRYLNVRVAMIVDTGDHATRNQEYGYLGRPKVGDVTRVWRERAFKVDAIFVEEDEK